jgi:hypothetical protein
VYLAIKNQQRKESLRPVEFKPVNWQPQVQVKFTRTVTGWLDRDKRTKWQFAAGSTHMVDEQHAIEFIVKGYATGELPRPVSDDERADIRSVMTTIGLGQQPQARA